MPLGCKIEEYFSMKTKKILTIIIITYNSQNCIESCLQSIKVQNVPTNILIIDNNSTDKTWRKLQTLKASNIDLIKNKVNSGFARAVNQGFKYSNKNFKNSLFLLLNPDAVLDDFCLARLIEAIDSNPKLGLCSPIIKNPTNNQLIFQQGKIDWWQMRTLHVAAKSLSSDYLTGCCLLIKKAVIDKIDGFDERFFLYYEDADFCLRARQNGFQLKTVSKAICFHQESQSSDSDTKTYYLVKNGLIFFHKHFSLLTKLLYFWPIFFLRLIYHLLISRKKNIVQAFKDFYFNK